MQNEQLLVVEACDTYVYHWILKGCGRVSSGKNFPFNTSVYIQRPTGVVK
jgi:hypothetical protein